MVEQDRFSVDLTSRLAAVSGGAGLIGAEIVKCLCAWGAEVFVLDVADEKGKDLVSKTQKTGGKCHYRRMDLSTPEGVPGKLSALEDDVGSFSIWVNCAYPHTTDWNTNADLVTPENISINLNLQLASLCVVSLEMAKRMALRGGGSIVNIGSVHGLVAPNFRNYEGTGMTSPPAYAAIKGGLASFGRYLASCYGSRGVRVNTVSPGGVLNHQPKPFLEKYAANTCLGRLAMAWEIPPAVAFLASEAASYITGIDLPVDGGLTAL